MPTSTTPRSRFLDPSPSSCQIAARCSRGRPSVQTPGQEVAARHSLRPRERGTSSAPLFAHRHALLSTAIADLSCLMEGDAAGSVWVQKMAILGHPACTAAKVVCLCACVMLAAAQTPGTGSEVLPAEFRWAQRKDRILLTIELQVCCCACRRCALFGRAEAHERVTPLARRGCMTSASKSQVRVCSASRERARTVISETTSADTLLTSRSAPSRRAMRRR